MAGPYFIPDIYSKDQGPTPDFATMAADPRMVGCIIKATQGVSYSPSWFTTNWARLRAAGGARYGTSWFRGCYHFATPDASGTAQADYVVAALERAGGWDPIGDMPPAWDFEDSKAKIWTGRGISKQQVIDISSQFAERIKALLGRAPILYTGATWRTYGITESAGFRQLWTSHLDKMAPYGWPNDRVALWQYAGDSKFYNPLAALLYKYPTTIQGLTGKIDMNVVLDGGAPAASIERVRAVLIDGQTQAPAWTPSASSVPRPMPTAPLPAPPPVIPSRGMGDLAVPIGIGAGLLLAGVLLTRFSKERLF